MWNKIKCFFGFHNWMIIKEYGDLLGFVNKYPANITERHCINCDTNERKIEWLR